MGLAQFLAERGFLPMYGMPSRVRPLYMGARNAGTREAEFSVVDREVDVAVFELTMALCVGGRAATARRVPRMKITVRTGVRSGWRTHRARCMHGRQSRFAPRNSAHR